jgi:hypothetical protein
VTAIFPRIRFKGDFGQYAVRPGNAAAGIVEADDGFLANNLLSLGAWL